MAAGRAEAMSERRPDFVASVALLLVALTTLGLSLTMPWWTMKARAPQYGQRVLVVDVSPRLVTGDVFELDTLGHYVGIRPMARLATVERRLAPIGMGAVALGLVVAPWLRRRWLRVACALPAVLMPVVFLADLDHWLTVATQERAPDSALGLTVPEINAELATPYKVGQFEVEPQAGGGLYLAGVTAMLALGLAFAVPWPRPQLQRRAARRALASSASLGLVALTPAAEAAELRVAPGETIAATLARAGDGDRVIVPAGVWREHLVIRRRTELAGEPGAVIDGGGEGTVVRIEASGSVLAGFAIRGSGDRYRTEDAGVRIQAASDVVVRDLRIEDTLFGVFAAQADRCRLDQLDVVGKDLDATRRGDGIRLWYSGGCEVRRCRVDRSRDVAVWYSQGTLFEDNEVRRSRYGLHYMYSDGNRFRRNRFEDNQVGAAIMYSRGVELYENSFSFSNGVAAYGLLVKDADDVFVERNRFVGNATALFFDNAPQSQNSRAVVRNNLVARNDVGLALLPLSRDMEIWDNAFVGNAVQVQIQGAGTGERNRWAAGGRGNYWSDAVPYDRDGDGVSELPYRVESGYEALADAHPVLSFFHGSPAADAVDAAARLFPLFGTRLKLEDPHPLVEPPGGWVDERDAEPNRLDLLAAGTVLIGLGLGVGGVSRRVLA